MTPTTIAPDAKGAASLRARGAAGSAKADSGPGFDGVLARLGDGTADADGKLDGQASAAEDKSTTPIASGVAGDASLIAALMDRAAGASPASHAKSSAGDDDAGVSSQTMIPPGLMSLLVAVPSGVGGSLASGATAGTTATKRADAETVAATAAPSTGLSAVGSPGRASVDATADAAATGQSILVPTPPTAIPESALGAIGSLDVRVAAPKGRAEKATAVDSVDPAATLGAEADAMTLQSVSVSTHVAPSTSTQAGALTHAAVTTGAGTGGRGADAERASAATGKTDSQALDAGMPVPATIATIADAVSDLADTAATASAPTTPSTTPTLAPARTMVLQLAPTDLGTVSVRLHLTGQSLDVQLSVSDPKTLGLVSRERAALAARLDDRGYQLNTLTIQGTDPSASSTAGSHDTSHTGADTTHDQSADGGRRGTPGQSGRETSQRSPGDSARGGDASVDGRGGLYI